MAIYLGLVFAGLVVSAWLIHRDGIAIGRSGRTRIAPVACGI